MKTTVRIQVSYANQLSLMEDLNARFPEGIHKIRDGRVTAFIIEGDKSAPNIQAIIKHIGNKGYTLTESIRKYSKTVCARQQFLYDKSDLDAADYLHINCKKTAGMRGSRGDVTILTTVSAASTATFTGLGAGVTAKLFMVYYDICESTK